MTFLKKILAINCGSSSFKYKLFNLDDESVIAEGMADRVGIPGSNFTIEYKGDKRKLDKAIPDQKTAVSTLLEQLQAVHAVNDLSEIVGVGHRIVAGGETFKDSALITKDNLHEVYDLVEYAPLHNKPEADAIKAFLDLLPNAAQVGVFDSAFHQTMDPVHYLYPIPYEYYQKYKARKYGAHGTSVRYVSARAAEMMHKDLKDLKLIVCHLGSGASVTAVKNGKSYDTSMGFSPLGGIMMGTRSGDVDASVLQFVMDKEHISIDQMIEILNHKSGLLGVSGISSDMRDITKHAGEKRADLALKMFNNRVIRFVGAYMAELNGADAIVFTAGIGEHDSAVRKQVSEAFSYMGVKIDDKANATNGEKFISTDDSSVKVLVIPTNEELMIERDVVRLAHLK